MESTEDIKKYISVAHSLSREARNLPEFSGTNEDSALQRMGALLASNCEKLCIGPSFHFYTAENSQSLMEQLEELKEPLADEISDEGEYETVIYKGPDMPYEIVDDTIPEDDVRPNSRQDGLKLANTSAEYSRLLSPDFFLQCTSSGSSSRTSDMSSTENRRCPNMPFSLPDVSHVPNMNTENATALCDNAIQRLERIELVEDTSTDNESEWIEWPKKFIENNGFCLGIQPGNFFKEESRSRFYVKLPHRSKYEVLITNNNQVPCDLDLYIDGQHSNSLRIPAGVSRSIDGPQYSKLAFKFFRAEDPPPGKKVKRNTKNGLVKAVFVPCQIGNSRLRAVSEPIRPDIQNNGILDLLHEDIRAIKEKRAFTINCDGQDAVERSLDMSHVSEGATFLQGQKRKQSYIIAPVMETDLSKKVILQLRLIASLDEEIDATEEAVCDLEPPPLPRKE